MKNRSYKKRLKAVKSKISISKLILIAILAIVGVTVLTLSHAASPYASIEAESGTLSGGSTINSDTNASGGNYMQFAASSGTGTGNCTNPIWSSSAAGGTDNIGSGGLWWVNNDLWSGTHGPQTINACNYDSWYAVSNQPDNGGAVETYPDTEYDVGGRNGGTTKTLAQFNSITSTFAEAYPSAGAWDAAYDLWTDNWSHETMIWNQWAGSTAYWPGKATIAVSLNGVPYHFYANGNELMFFRDTQVTSGSVDILAAYKWEIANGYASSSAVPTQLEYGVEVCSTTGNETFPMTGLTFSLN